MSIWFHRPLAVKLNLVMTVLVIATAASVTLLSLRRERQTFVAELRQQAEVLLISLSLTSEDALYFQNRMRLVDLAARLRDREVVELVRFFDQEGQVLADSEAGEDQLSLEIDPFGQRLVQTASGDSLFILESDRLVAGRAVAVGGSPAGAVSIELSAAPLRSKLRALRQAGIGVALAAILAVSAVTLLVSRSLMRPLRLLVRSTRSIAEGDLAGAESLEEIGREVDRGSKDEVHQLLAAEARMVAYLREMAQVAEAIARADLSAKVEPRSEVDILGQALGKMAESLRQLIGDVRTSAAQVASSAEQISSSASQMSRGASNQSEVTEETSVTMVEIAGQIESIAGSARDLATTVEESSTAIQTLGGNIDRGAREAAELRTAIDRIASTIAEMAATSLSTAAKVGVVDDVSQEAARTATEGGEQLSRVIAGIAASGSDIGKMVQLIEDIADQTNLLALNAAIQAAHAGDAGRGFAVVADEVKRLAERSVSSTREIATIVEQVQSDTQHAVGLTETVLKQIVDCVTRTNELVGEVSQEIRDQSARAAEVLAGSEQIRTVTRRFAAGAEEQARGAQEIVNAVQSMNQMTHQVARATGEQKRGGNMVVASLEHVAQVATEHSAATEELSATTVQLAQEAERLHRMAAVFRFEPGGTVRRRASRVDPDPVG